MINIHLLVDESYIEELMMFLPKDKVKVVEKEFEANRILLENTFDAYQKKRELFIPYKDCLENVNAWLRAKE